MSRYGKYAYYEMMKKQIYLEAKSHKEYEKRIIALARRLGI